MPTLWRYLLNHYLKVLCLCVFSFIAILLVTRLDEIAHFAALGGQSSYLALFTLYQIPYILPIAIPISALISSMILFQKLSHSQELTAMRASGFSLKMIISPLLLAGFLLCLLNFYISSELSTQSRLSSRKMIHELTSVNPIVLLQNAKIAKLKGAYIQMETLRNGELAKDVIIVVNSRPCERLNVFVTKEMEVKNHLLASYHVSFITSIGSSVANEFDHLIIENQNFSYTQAPEFAHLLKKTSSKLPNDHLKLSHLVLRVKNLKNKFATSTQEQSKALADHAKRNLSRCYSDVLRRTSLGFAAFSFTLLGAVFGIDISRRGSKRGIIWVVCIGAISLISFFIGKELDHKFALSALLYFFPHVLILSSSLWLINRINHGIE